MNPYPETPGAATTEIGCQSRKWQETWKEQGTNVTDVANAPDPFYALMMFPYPSAEGLHVGHIDGSSRPTSCGDSGGCVRQRAKHPMGDAIRPARRSSTRSRPASIPRSPHPPENIATFKKQMKRLGLVMTAGAAQPSTTDPTPSPLDPMDLREVVRARLAAMSPR